MEDRTHQAPNKDAENNSLNSDFPKPQTVQLQEGALMIMEDALEERNNKNRRVNRMDLPASEERRKTDRRQSDKE